MLYSQLRADPAIARLFCVQIEPPIVEFPRRIIFGSLRRKLLQQFVLQFLIGKLLQVTVKNNFTDEFDVLLSFFKARRRRLQTGFYIHKARILQPRL